MKNIKYRVIYENKIWSVGYIDFVNRVVQIAIPVENSTKCYTHRVVSLDKVELEQFTGLKDKNGVEIYEGDIIDDGEADEWGYCHVRWNPDYAGFEIYNQCDTLLFPDYRLENVKVVGNIHMNRELMGDD